MKRRITGVAKITGSLALAGGMIMMAAMPAVAAAPNEAYAASATGLISASPIGLATFPGTSPVSLANADIAGLLTTGVITDRATATTAASTVADVAASLTLVASLAATSVSSSCSYNGSTVSGATTILDGTATVLGDPVVTLDASPSVNETLTVGGVLSITLNQQSVAADGTLTVSAIAVSVIGGTQTLTLGTSVCNAADLPVPMLPNKAAQLTLGGLVVLLIGGVGYRVNRRRHAAAA
jgi:hypothetical protein